MSLRSTQILSVPALAAATFPFHRMRSEAATQGKGGDQPSPPPVCSASNVPASFISSFHAVYLTCPCEGWGVRLGGASAPTAGQSSRDAFAAVALEVQWKR